MPRPVVEPNIFGQLSGTVSASLLDQNFSALTAVTNDSSSGWTNAATDTGSANNYVVTLTPPATAYRNGFFLSFVPLNQNTGASSINVNGLGNIPVVAIDGSALTPQILIPGTMYTLMCLNSAMRIISPAPALIGEVRMFSGAAAPTTGAWLVCNGEGVSTATYSALFKIIGYTFGGSGATFNVPNFGGRFAIHGTPGSLGGASQVALAIAHLPPHNHPVSDPGHSHGVSDPGHQHSYISNTSATSPSGGLVFSTATSLVRDVTSLNSSNIGIQLAASNVQTQNVGSGAAFSIYPPYLTLTFWVRAY